MLKLLIAEDEAALCRSYSLTLREAGYDTICASNGSEAWQILEREHIDLILTDLVMPEMDGYEFIRSVRKFNCRIPILIITARADFPSKQRGFTLGADDYMTKPIETGELLLRVKALLRRANIASDRQICVGRTVLLYDSLTVTRGASSQTLPQKEFFLLYKLLSYPDKIFTRVQIMDEIWGSESTSTLQTIDVHINRIRRHFSNNPDFSIVTVRGLGYKAVIRTAKERKE
ncbi:MAG: response regulator transcription factor [Eubacteriales bacterium]|nr:response regulator transcription factor [Eubacteriales bacterium]